MKNLLTKHLIQRSALLAFLLILAILGYTLQNTSGHTGFNPYLALWIFIPVSLIGLFNVLYTREQSPKKLPALLALTFGLLGILLLVYLDQSNTLLPYEVWIQRGMP
ncbi:MAG: hypothetical protein KDK66_00435 [Deltaproteobacteria bacterium]|nr:hypothetical protein [Deltaproteobacteria bacterium]